MNKNKNTKKTKKAITFERFVKRDPTLAKWVDDPTGFALVECGRAIDEESFPRGSFMALSFDSLVEDHTGGWIFRSTSELSRTIGAKFLVFENGDEMKNKILEEVREFHDVGNKPILMLFSPGTLKKCLNNPFFKMIAHRAVFFRYAK